MQYFEKFPVATKCMDGKGGEGYQNFLSKNFCLKAPKKFLGEPFSVSSIPGIETFYS